MGGASSKGRIEIDVKRQAWVRNRRPNPAHPKHQGLNRAQTTRSQNISGQTFLDDDSDDQAGEPPHERRHERPSHHDSRGLSRGQSGGRGMSLAQSNSRHGGPSQQGHDFAPPADHMRPQHAASTSQRGSQYNSQYGSQHGSHRGSQQRSQGQ